MNEVTQTPTRPARLALAGAIGFLALVALLHVLKPEIEPSWRFISEYAIGEYGWIMSIAFFAFAIAYLALLLAVRPYVRSVPGRIGLGLLLVSAAGLIIAGVFPADAVTTPKDAVTTSGKLHNIGGTLGMAMPFAAAFVSFALSRHPELSWARARLWFSAAIAWAGFVYAMVSLGILMSTSSGRFGPDVPVGWPNRLEVVGYVVWVSVVAVTLLKRRRG